MNVSENDIESSISDEINEIIERENKIKFIKKFSALNLKRVCKNANVSRQAIYQGEITLQKLDAVVDEIIKEISDLWEK